MDAPLTSRTSLVQSASLTLREGHVKLRATVLMATLIACLGAISFGFAMGYTSPADEELRQKLGLGDDAISWFGSLFSLGAMASISGSYFIDKFGRKFTVMLCSVPLVIGWVMIAGTMNSGLLYLGRIVTGLAVGVMSVTVPVYIAEISPAKYRGALGSCWQLDVSLGFLIAYLLGEWLKNFRWLAIAGAVTPTLMIVLMTMMPETPRWLIMNDQMSEGIRVMKWLRGESREKCEEECQNIVRNTLGTSDVVLLEEIKRPTVYRPLILSVLLMIFQQFSGVNAVLTYASEILKEAGFDNPLAVSNVITAVQVVATGIACLIVDKLGRRKLLLFAGITMGISMLILGFSKHYPGFPNSVVLLSLSLFIVGFSLGWGPIPWLVMSEVFPLRVRGIASGTATLVNWFCSFLVVKTFQAIQADFGQHGTFWFYGTFCLLSAIYVFFFLPETKGRALEEIEGLFENQLGLHSLPST